MSAQFLRPGGLQIVAPRGAAAIAQIILSRTWIEPVRELQARTTKHSKLPDYPQDTSRDMEHVKLLADRLEKYLQGVREARTVAEKWADTDTVDLFTQVITEFEKHAWFLRASLELLGRRWNP